MFTLIKENLVHLNGILAKNKLKFILRTLKYSIKLRFKYD